MRRPAKPVPASRRTSGGLALAVASAAVLAACAVQPPQPSPSHLPLGGDEGISREEAERLGVDVAPGDGRIVAVDAASGASNVHVSVLNASHDDDDYTVVLSADGRQLASAQATVPAGETVRVTVELAEPIERSTVLDVRLDGSLLGAGIALQRIAVE